MLVNYVAAIVINMASSFTFMIGSEVAKCAEEIFLYFVLVEYRFCYQVHHIIATLRS